MIQRRMYALSALVIALGLASCASGTGGASPSSSPASTGSTTATPSATPSDAEPAIAIDAPADDATVSVPFEATGTADTFEAALTVDVLDQEGFTMCVRHIMATSGSGTPGTWTAILAFPPEEDPLPVTVRAYTLSPKDGAMTDLVTRNITVSTDRPDIIMTSPTCGQVYPTGGLIFLLGTAKLFEAALTVELRDAGGTAVVSVPVTAEECCVESQFSSKLTVPADLAPGLYDVVAYSLSPADGSIQNEFTVQIQVTG
ncbi:Gmad2 immunoglobulin-like domain-containing protein [Microbacterium sp. B2969]|uniref:Gmad2 immunoglobulin-like domain-containing protein n=1 Tax=Microbacterium alkaliflavum TaxID=3248839 RepID=A0ABW7Q664_9MICO